MENIFYITGILFFLFVCAMLVELSRNIHKIAEHLNKLLQQKE